MDLYFCNALPTVKMLVLQDYGEDFCRIKVIVTIEESGECSFGFVLATAVDTGFLTQLSEKISIRDAIGHVNTALFHFLEKKPHPLSLDYRKIANIFLDSAISQLDVGALKFYLPVYLDLDMPMPLSTAKLDELLNKEAEHRFFNKKAKIIQNYWKQTITNPYHILCQRRLINEFYQLNVADV